MTDQLGPDFDDRLTAELDRFDGPTPMPDGARFSRPRARYAPLGPFKLVAALAAALAVLLVAVSAFAGSPDPGVWTRRAVNSFESVTHAAQPSPSPESGASRNQPAQTPARAQPTKTSAPRRESPEPSGGSDRGPWDSPAPSPWPGPDHHDDPSPNPRPSPSPSPDRNDGSDGGAHGTPPPPRSDR